MANPGLYTLLGLVVGIGFFLYNAYYSEHAQQQRHSRNRRPPPDSNWSTPATSGQQSTSSDSNLSSFTSRSEDEECSICLSKVGDDDRQLACGHYFHSGCIDKWLGASKFCPNCREPIIFA